jgi:hypothetical protein
MMFLGDQLLYVISARHEVPWQSFRTIVDSVMLQQLSQENQLPLIRRHVVRALEGLGHCDIEFGENVYAAPAALVLLPRMDVFETVLAGFRTPSTWQQLQQVCAQFPDVTLVSEDQDPPFATVVPRIYRLSAPSLAILEAFAMAAHLVFEGTPAAWKVVNVAAGLDEYKTICNFKSSEDINWRRTDFDPERQRFVAKSLDTRSLRLSQYVDPKKSTLRYWLWRDGAYAEVNPDWGRYWVLSELCSGVLYYDRTTGEFAFPAAVPLPRLYQRSLALCSGATPKIRKLRGARRDFLIYKSVPRAIALLVAQKLRQDLMECSLSNSFEDIAWTIQ